MKVVLLTGAERRHEFFRLGVAQSPHIEVLTSFCEGDEQSLANRVQAQEKKSALMEEHIAARARSEEDFFGTFCSLTSDLSKPHFIRKGQINGEETTNKIKNINPDLIASYGCSLIQQPLIKAFEGRFINVHLGLSPYYRGSGTNFWALVNNQPECMGATFMYIDSGIDTGAIIHQIRARALSSDTPHMMGNRLIADMVITYRKIIENFESVQKFGTAPSSFFGTYEEKFYKRADFSEEATKKLYENFENKLPSSYVENIEERQRRFPIFENGAL